MNDKAIDQVLRGRVPNEDAAAQERARARLLRAIEEAENPAEGRRPRGLMWWAAAAVLALATLVTSAILLPASRAPSASARILELGRLSAAQPTIHTNPSDVLYRRFEERRSDAVTSAVDGSSYVTESHVVTESWLRGDGSGLVRSRWLEDTEFPSPQDRQSWVAAGRLPIPVAGDVQSMDYGPGELRVYDIAALPTDANSLRGVLERGLVVDPGIPSNLNLLSAIGQLLSEQDVPAELRLALFQVASELPGIEVRDDAVDPLGRSTVAVELRLEDSTVALYLDPTTADLLAKTESYALPSRSPLFEWQAYLSAGIVSEVGERPVTN
jgi:hypothetical protein